MMDDWQTWCALVVVAFSFAIVLRRFLGVVNGKAENGCGACPNKSVPPLMKTLPLVQIGVVKSRSQKTPN